MRAVSNHTYKIWACNTKSEHADRESFAMDNFIEAAAVFRALCAFMPSGVEVQLMDGETGEILADNQ